MPGTDTHPANASSPSRVNANAATIIAPTRAMWNRRSLIPSIK
ncbi:Uncharacterised protein [Mycobacterium tuberculosis]|nr:Uncharacterised protein [Mycobacterium tuberculosis]